MGTCVRLKNRWEQITKQASIPGFWFASPNTDAFFFVPFLRPVVSTIFGTGGKAAGA
jgi:hypothetical protein